MVNAPDTAVDGFGRRTTGTDSETGDEVELLDLAPQLVEHSGFVTTVGERVARFAAVRHASYVHLRRLDRPSADRLELVSDYTPGWRVSELLNESSGADIPVDITVVIGILRQLLPAVALYGRHNREAAIGTLAVERLIVTPQSRLVIAEHAFGPALEKLNIGRDRLWRELRVAMPPSAGLPRSNQRADANAIGVVALSLLLGRVLAAEEYPAPQPLIEGLTEHRDGKASPLSPAFSTWLQRALQCDARTAFQAPSEAQLAFESVLASDRSYVTSTAKLEEWVANVGGRLEARKPQPAPDPEILRQQELERQQALERQQQEELERQQDEEREREREQELARLRELEKERAGEMERLREQERQRALELDRLREQEREREQAREREREQERKREQERQRELEHERDRARALEKSAAAAAAAAEAAAAIERATAATQTVEPEPEPEPEPVAWVAPPVVEEADPIAAQIASYRPPVREVEEVPAYQAPVPEKEEPAQEAPAALEPAQDAPVYEEPAQEAPAQEAPRYEEPAPEPAYAQQAAPAPSAYSISDEPVEKKGTRLPLLAMAAVVLLLLGVVGWLATRDTGGGGGLREGEGELAVTSRPDGAIVKVDGKDVGRTPVTVRLPSGPHVLEVQVGKAEPRVIPLTITAGVQTSQYIEMQGVIATGSLEIRSNPTGARVTIDGQPRGTTPATIPNLPAGTHTVVLELGGRKVSQAVKIDPGSTAQLVVPIPRK